MIADPRTDARITAALQIHRALHEAGPDKETSVNPETGLLLCSILLNSSASAVLEIGRFYGISTTWLAAACAMVSDRTGLCGRVDSYDPTPPPESLGPALATAFGTHCKTRLVVGSSPELEGNVSPYDAVFVDGDHSYEACLRDLRRASGLIRQGGLIVVHDVLCPFQGPVRAAFFAFAAEQHFMYSILATQPQPCHASRPGGCCGLGILRREFAP